MYVLNTCKLGILTIVRPCILKSMYWEGQTTAATADVWSMFQWGKKNGREKDKWQKSYCICFKGKYWMQGDFAEIDRKTREGGCWKRTEEVHYKSKIKRSWREEDLLFLASQPILSPSLFLAACVFGSAQFILENITVNFYVPEWVECRLHCSSIRFWLTDSMYTFNNAGQCLTFASVQHQHTPGLPDVELTRTHTHQCTHATTFAHGPAALGWCWSLKRHTHTVYQALIVQQTHLPVSLR